MNVVEILLELVRYILPALVVYLLMRQFIRGQLAVSQMNMRESRKADNRGLRLQAYERLMLFTDRISIINLLLRLNSDEMDKRALKNAIVISIQKEFEHNLTQQIYVSSSLWKMITLLKDKTIESITQSFLDQEKKDGFVEELVLKGKQIDLTMGDKCSQAIRKEVELFFL